MLSKTNSISRGPYVFQPTKYDKDGNIYCMIVKRHTYTDKRTKYTFVNDRCKLTGLYKFDEDVFEIIYESEGFMNRGHKKLLNWFLEQYDWCVE